MEQRITPLIEDFPRSEEKKDLVVPDQTQLSINTKMQMKCPMRKWIQILIKMKMI